MSGAREDVAFARSTGAAHAVQALVRGEGAWPDGERAALLKTLTPLAKARETTEAPKAPVAAS